MNDKQRRFVAEFIVDTNATQAAIRAGYTARSAYSTGERLLRNAEVSAAILEAQKAKLEQVKITALRVIEEYTRLGTIDSRSFFNEDGSMKPVREWTAEQGAAVGSFEVLIKNAQAGDGITDTIHKVKLWDKTRALESLAKHFGLLTEKVEHSGSIAFKWQD